MRDNFYLAAIDCSVLINVTGFAWNAKRFAVVACVLLLLVVTLSALSRISEQKILEIQCQSLKYTVVVKTRKNLSNNPFLSKRYQAITVFWCKQPTSNSFQTCLYYIYLLKLYDTSIIILLTNDLTNICSKISRIWLILWMALSLQCERVGRSWKVG